MRFYLGLLSLILPFLSLSACALVAEQSGAGPQENAARDADMAAIEHLRTDFVTAYNAKDGDGLLSIEMRCF